MIAGQIISYFVRLENEVTFEEVRAHLGIETQRQWSDQAIARATLSLMALFGIVTLWAEALQKKELLDLQFAACYHREHPTFSNALAAVRTEILKKREFCIWDQQCDMIKIPKGLLSELTMRL